jgi:uncharacterized radical SAM superfamily protein
MDRMPNANRNLIVGSEILFVSNNLLEMFSKDHDIFTFHHERHAPIDQTAKQVWRDLKPLLAKGYDRIIFIGYRDDSDIVFDLYENRKLIFDAAVFVNYEQFASKLDYKDYLAKMKQDGVDLYSFSFGTDKKKLANLIETHQSLSFWTNLRSLRLAQEIYGCVVYGTYKLDYLAGSNTRFV